MAEDELDELVYKRSRKYLDQLDPDQLDIMRTLFTAYKQTAEIAEAKKMSPEKYNQALNCTLLSLIEGNGEIQELYRKVLSTDLHILKKAVHLCRTVEPFFGRKNLASSQANLVKLWRRERDSNPRFLFPGILA